MTREHDRQRKLRVKAKKAKNRRERKRGDVAKPPLSAVAARGLDEADELLAGGEIPQAIVVLEELGRRYPRRVEILARLAEVYLQADHQWAYQATCEKLAAAIPNQPMSWLTLAAAALANVQPSVAHCAFARLATDWPDHPEAAQSRQMQESLREILTEECRRCGLNEEIGFRVLLLHDDINLNLQCGNYDKVCEVATRLLTICPTFAPALNNRSQAHFSSARYAEALADSRRVLQFEPTNYHALANLTRHLYLSGQFDDAQTIAVELKACPADNGDALLKKAEAFAILGDWEAVRQAIDEGQGEWAKMGGMPALAEHLAGVALANLGDLEAASRHWSQAAVALDTAAWASENLEDLRRSPGQQHGPWAYPLEYWAPIGALEGVFEAAAARRKSDATRGVQRHFERFPQLEILADAILERSDPGACEMLIRLAAIVERPAMFAAIKKFALGKRGSDDLRMKALTMLSRAKQVEGQLEMWREGTWRPIALTSQELYWEPIVDLPPEVNALMISAQEAIYEERGVEAERLLDEALRLRPDDLSAQFNRAVAIRHQGRDDEALEIIRRIHRDHPDYLFARAYLAETCIADGDLAQAKTLLAAIPQMQRLHVSEYTAWCSASITLALAMDEPKIARGLLDAWENVTPDDHRIKIWKGRIHSGQGLLARLSGFLK